MGAQKKKVKKDDYYEHLQFIPFLDEESLADGMDYNEMKAYLDDYFKEFEENKCTPIQCVCSTFYHCLDHCMDLNGVEKAFYIINAMLYLIEKDAVKGKNAEQLAYEAHYDLKDLETGNYDYLFEPEDLKLMKEDMKKVREYLNEHPELTD